MIFYVMSIGLLDIEKIFIGNFLFVCPVKKIMTTGNIISLYHDPSLRHQ